jgi:hypothetical protein
VAAATAHDLRQHGDGDGQGGRARQGSSQPVVRAAPTWRHGRLGVRTRLRRGRREAAGTSRVEQFAQFTHLFSGAADHVGRDVGPLVIERTRGGAQVSRYGQAYPRELAEQGLDLRNLGRVARRVLVGVTDTGGRAGPAYGPPHTVS